MGQPKGQHFLRDRAVVAAMLRAADLKPRDHVVEIGAGKGIVTEVLARRIANVTAVEIDETLLPYLRALRVRYPNIEIVHGDVLKFTPPKTPYKVIGSIPYYITSPIINHFLYEQAIQGGRLPERMVLLVQKEVAEKICAKTGRWSVLALNVQVFGTPRIIRTVSRHAFTPPPKVASAILYIEIYKKQKISGDFGTLFELIHAGFAYRRKTMHNALQKRFGKEKTSYLLARAGIDGNRRAETLTLTEWQRLFLSQE